MRYLYKHLTKELCKNRIFLVLLFVLSSFTSFMYYFVHFSIDGNMKVLNGLSALTENQVLYRTGLISNTILARNILTAFIGLTGFVFAMFYHRFFKINGKQIGVLKAIGFKDRILTGYFMTFTGGISGAGAVAGVVSGYFASGILINAGRESYMVENLVKEISAGTFLIGFFLPMFVFSMVTGSAYLISCRKEAGLLLGGMWDEKGYTRVLKFADKAAGCVPEKYKLPVRLAFRKPVTVVLILISVASFSIMFIMAYSLNLSSGVVFRSQTEGHNYLYNTQYSEPQNGAPDTVIADMEMLVYLDTESVIEENGICADQMAVGLDQYSDMFRLTDKEGRSLQVPLRGEIIIGEALKEMYGFQKGDKVILRVDKVSHEMLISDVAFNATAKSIYMDKGELADMMGLPQDSYTGVLSMQDGLRQGGVITHDEKLEQLRRDSVSNKSSAVINQVIGCLVGCILLYLALLLNFQDSRRDIVIMSVMGYDAREIRKMLLDIYRPVLWITFILTLIPGIQTVKGILRSMSVQIGDYMPFQTNAVVILGIFLLLNLIYALVQSTFNRSVRKIMRKENIVDYTQ